MKENRLIELIDGTIDTVSEFNEISLIEKYAGRDLAEYFKSRKYEEVKINDSKIVELEEKIETICEESNEYINEIKKCIDEIDLEDKKTDKLEVLTKFKEDLNEKVSDLSNHIYWYYR